MAELAQAAPPGAGAGLLAGDPSRAFVIALRNGLSWLLDHPEAWATLFRQADSAELDSIKSFFSEDGRGARITVRKGYPAPEDVKGVQITVLPLAEQPVEAYLGDEINECLEWGIEETATVRAEVASTTISVMILADHPDLVLYLSRACDSILGAHKDWFVRAQEQDGAGLISADWDSSAEVGVEEKLLPRRIWGRQIRWRVMAFFGSMLPIPAPTRAVLVHLNTEVVQGRRGGVAVVV